MADADELRSSLAAVRERLMAGIAGVSEQVISMTASGYRRTT
jgi:hypothetical protein